MSGEASNNVLNGMQVPGTCSTACFAVNEQNIRPTILKAAPQLNGFKKYANDSMKVQKHNAARETNYTSLSLSHTLSKSH